MKKLDAKLDPLGQDREDESPDPLAEARREARQRIDEERKRYPERLGHVFRALAAGLFESGFEVETAVPDPDARRRFRVAVGETPRTYRDRHLLDAALELVRKTRLPVLEIAAGLGFEDPELFGKWFKWRTGKAPMAVRSRADPPPDPRPTPPAEADHSRTWTDRKCRKAAAWDVSPPNGATLVRKIRELYPELEDPSPEH